MSSAPQIEYQQEAKVYPSYGWTQIYSTTGDQTLSLGTGGAQTTIFELDNVVMNLSRSYLSFVATIPASGAGVYNHVFADFLSAISRVYLQTATGLNVAEVRTSQLTTKAIRRVNTRLNDFLTKPLIVSGGHYNEMLSRSNALGSANYRPDGSTTEQNYTGPRLVVSGADNGAVTLNIRIPLSVFIHSILEIDTDIYWNQVMRLRIEWAPSTQIYWTGTSGTNPNTGAAVATAPVSLSGIQLYLAVEKNLAVANAIIESVTSGKFSMLTEFQVHETLDITGTSKSYNTRHNSAYGQRLLRIYCFRSTTSDTGNAYLNLDTSANANIQEYNTKINGSLLQPFKVDMSTDMDWFLHKKKLDGSVYQDVDEYKNVWCHIDSWEVLERFVDRERYYFNIVQGLPLTQEILHTWDMTTVNATDRLHKISVYQRELKISAKEVQLI